MVLGALLGLILGLGGAGLVETLRPTLVGSDTVAAEFDAPLLGTFTSHPSAAEATTIGARLRLAADAAELGSVALLPAQSHLDFEPLAQALNASPSVGGAATNGNGGDDGHRRALHVVPFRAENPPANNGRRSGLVVVSPTVLKKRDLTAIPHLLRATHLPLVGVITYAEPRTGAAAAIKDKVARLVEAVT
jgi:hypothetical protein